MRLAAAVAPESPLASQARKWCAVRRCVGGTHLTSEGVRFRRPGRPRRRVPVPYCALGQSAPPGFASYYTVGKALMNAAPGAGHARWMCDAGAR